MGQKWHSSSWHWNLKEVSPVAVHKRAMSSVPFVPDQLLPKMPTINSRGSFQSFFLRYPSMDADAKIAEYNSAREYNNAVQIHCFPSMFWGPQCLDTIQGVHDNKTIFIMIPSHSLPLSLSLVYSRSFQRLHYFWYHNRLNEEDMRTFY